MRGPLRPDNEQERLAALKSYAVLDTASEAAFDALAELAAFVVGVPIGLVSLVDEERQWFKARYGLEAPETSREVSFCGHVVESGLPLVVQDATIDPRFLDNPLVTGEPHVRFYAGWPLRTSGGYVLGTLCAIGDKPSELSAAQKKMLEHLASQAVQLLELRRQRMALAESEARLRALFDGLAEGVVLHRKDGSIASINRAAERILGVHEAQAIGVGDEGPVWNTIRPDGSHFPVAEHPAARTLATGLPEVGVILGLYRPNDDLVWISINSTPLFAEDGSVSSVVVSFSDVTALRQAEHEREQLAQQQRLVTTGTLAAGVGHEINNPLVYVVSNVEMALEEIRAISGGSPSGRMRSIVEALVDAREGAERIRRIVRGLRALAREDAHPVATDLQQAVEISIHMAMHEIRHRAELIVSLGELPLVYADESRLVQLLVNLLVNAGQAFIAPNTEVNKVTVSARVSGENVILMVSDNGPGVAPEVVGRIFDPFFTTKPIGQGTGLGLSICNSIMSSLGGSLRYAGRPGTGAVFEAVLKIASHAADAAVSGGEVQGSLGGKILAIDDDEVVLRSMLRALEQEHSVVGVTDPREALRRLQDGERFDVIFCDVAMPHVDGIAVLTALKKIDKAQADALVFVTASDLDDVPRELLSVEVIEKPFTMQVLRSVARKLKPRSHAQ
jgi:PAS domain S-box-containing protein